MEDQGIMLPHGTNTMRFIYLQLLELARECDSTIQSGGVNTSDFLELENRLEKLLYETHSAYNPPVRKPQMSDFKEIKNLASGDFGSVEHVRHKKTGQSFAMKLVYWESVTTLEQVQQLFVMRDILTFAENPFITSMACSFETDMYLGFVVDYVEGPNCESQLGVLKRFPLDMARLYVAETVIAVNYLHGLGIVHRDLKPANMLISATGHIKLTDFGISKIGPVNMTTDRHQGSILDIVREFTDREMTGSPLYISPEMLLQEGYGKPIDWWALGIILHKFLIGVVPFNGHTLMELFTQVLKQKLTWPEGRHELTDDAKDLITALLKKNPAERLGTRGAYELGDHPFFQNLDMNNLLSEVPLYIPKLEGGDTCSENNRETEDEEDSAVDENIDEDEEDNTSFNYVAFRFRKAYDRPTPLKCPSSSMLHLRLLNIQECAESLDDKEVMTHDEGKVEGATKSLDDEEYMASDEDSIEEDADSLDEEVMPHNDGNVEEADEILPHATNTVMFIYLQLLELALECDSTVKSGIISTKNLFVVEDRLEKLLYETLSAFSPPVRKPQMSDFEELLHLASGKFGSVELVRHKKTGQSFAMKLVDRESVTTPAQVQQLYVERDILTFAESPFITSMACSFETNMYLGFVMDYVEGPNCESQLDLVKRFPMDMARLYVAETAMALNYLHGLGIVHRDVKPANILICATGHIKLTDFGISKIGPVNMTTEPRQGSIRDIVREFTDGEIAGSPVYIAPEVILKEGYGKPIDWWALGIILYEFLIGDVPFDEVDKDTMFAQVLTYELTWPEGRHDVTDDARSLITALLKKNPAERLGTRGAHEVKDHPFFKDLNMDNLLSEVPLFIPELDYGDTKSAGDQSDTFGNGMESRNDSKSKDEEDSPIGEYLDEDDNKQDKEGNLSFNYVAFRFRKANDEEQDMPNNEGYFEKADEIVPHATNPLRFIFLQLLHLARECDSTIQSGLVITNDFLELADKLEKLLYEIHSVYSPPVRKPQMSDFEELQHLASGNFGSVELVRHKKTGQSFAMKLVDRKSLTTPAQVQQLYVERDILIFAENPFITSMACSFETNMYLGFVMDYVEGIDCDYALDVVKRFPLDMARLYVAETVMAVKYLHSLGIVHRDVKPANLLISTTGHIKLTDFGISKIGPVNMTLERHQGTMHHIVREFNDREIFGSLVYIAPEVLFQEGYGKPVDWWALGIILYEFLLSDVPFDGRDMKEQFNQMLIKKLTWPEEKHELTDDAKDLITALLKKNPAERLGTRGAHEVKDHPFFQNLNMNNLMSEVPLYIPELDYGDSCSENDSEPNEEEESAVDENLENEENYILFTYVAFRFRKANDEKEDMPKNERHVAEAAESLVKKEVMTSSEENVKEAAESLDDEEDKACSEGNLEETVDSLDDEKDITSCEDKFKEAAESLDDEEDMTSSEENFEETAESLDEEEFMTSSEENVEEADEILDEEESVTSSEENFEETAGILNEEESMTSSEDDVEEAAGIINEEESMTSSEDDVEEAAGTLDDEESMTSSEDDVEEAAGIINEEEFMTSSEDDLEEAAGTLDEEEFMTPNKDNVKEAAGILEEEEYMTSSEENVEEAAGTLDEEEFMTSSEENVEEADEILDEEESMSSSEESYEETAGILDEEEVMTSSEDNVEEDEEILDEEVFITSSKDNVKEAAGIVDDEEFMSSSEDDVEEAAGIINEEELMTSSEDDLEEAAGTLDEEEFMTSNKDNVKEAAGILEEEEYMTSSEENVEEAAGIHDEEEFMTSSEENVEEADEILDEEESMSSSEENYEETAGTLDEEEVITSSKDNVKEAAGIIDDEEFMTSSEDDLEEAAGTLDEEEFMTSNKDNVKEAAGIVDDEESMSSSEDDVEEAAGTLDEEEFLTPSEKNVKEAAGIHDEEEFMTSSEDDLEEAAGTLDEEEFLTPSEKNVKEAAGIHDEEEFMTSSEENVEEAEEILDEEESMTSTEDNVEEAAGILDEEVFLTSSEENVEEAAGILEEEFMTSTEDNVEEADKILDEEEVMTSSEENFKEAAGILDHEQDMAFDRGDVEEAAERS